MLISDGFMMNLIFGYQMLKLTPCIALLSILYCRLFQALFFSSVQTSYHFHCKNRQKIHVLEYFRSSVVL